MQEVYNINMSFIKKINSLEIYDNVFHSVKNSKSEICMTMDLAQELSKPISKDYYNLLNFKSTQGVKICRLCFGSESDYKLFIKEKVGYKNIFVGNCFYLRMICIDTSVIFFNLFGQFYTSSNPIIINLYMIYFNKIYGNTV
jgi:hypothetical protein